METTQIPSATIYVASSEQLNTLIRSVITESLSGVLKESLANAGDPAWYTPTEAQRLTGWSKRTFAHLRKTRQIAFSQHGRKILYSLNSINKFLASHEVSTK